MFIQTFSNRSREFIKTVSGEFEKIGQFSVVLSVPYYSCAYTVGYKLIFFFFIWYLVSRVDQIKYDLEELPVHGELVNRLHMSKVPYRKRREEGITGPLEVVLCQYKPYP